VTIHIREHRPGENLGAFIGVAHEVFRGDPCWVPPLELDMRERLTPRKNPFFEHGEAMLFTAWRGNRLLGRCSAQIDREHLRIYNDETGFFGFFDTVDDEEVARALIDAATSWCGRRGMKRLRGPLSLTINDEVGTLVEGFDTPPFVLMGHSRDYQGGLAEAAGLAKVKDMLAWKYEVGKLPARSERAWRAVHEMPEVRLRSMRKKDMASEAVLVMEIFNDAWSDNWGFVPMTESQIKKMAKELRLFLDENLAFIAEIDGKPMAVLICLPNLNESIQDLGGKLFPFGLPKLLWRLKMRPPRTARVVLLGIRKELRGVKRYGALALAMCTEVAKRGAAQGITWGELSWTLEDNAAVNLGIRAMNGRVYKRYRVYEKAIAD